MGRLSPARLATSGLALLAAVLAVLWLVPSSDYIFLPDPAHPTAPLVRVPAPKDDSDGGGVYFVDVVVRKATLLERLFPGIRDGASLVSPKEYNPSGASDEQIRKENAQLMSQSQNVAAAVALTALGYPNPIREAGAAILNVARPALRRAGVKPGDAIVAIDGEPVRNVADLRRLLGRHRAGERVRLGLRHGGATRTVSVTTARDPKEQRTILGVGVATATRIGKLPVAVKIDAGTVGGPSAGLAFALETMEKLGKDVDHGLKVAATGTIEPDGSVGAIGGVKQKTLGARQAKVDVFLVPAGDNARIARRYADGLRIVPVETFRQALRVLATLGSRG